MVNKFGIKAKLTLGFLGVGLLPLLAVSIYTYSQSVTSLKNEAVGKTKSINELKRKSIEGYFNLLKSQLLSFAHTEQTKQAYDGFRSGFETFQNDNGLTAVDMITQKYKLQKFYKEQFEVEYLKQNDGKKIDSQSLVEALSPAGLALQASYIADNSNPLGSKHLLSSLNNRGRYNIAHTIYHKDFREFLEKFELYDIFLIDAKTGDVVYTVFKELDFATNLKSGAYATSGLAKAFNGALALKGKEDVYMEDYSPYTPSYDGPAGFIAAPIYKNNEIDAVIAFQISFDKINSFTLVKSGTENLLETFIIGSDFKMRSDSTFDNVNRNVRSSFRNPAKGSIETSLVKDVFNTNKSVEDIRPNYLGQEAIVTSSPMDILGNKWQIQTQYQTSEAFAPIFTMRWILGVMATICAFVITLLGTFFARNLAGALIQLANGLRKEANTVSDTSISVAEVSGRLSEASTEQAASLQETVASIDEISAMVARNADSAASSAKSSETTTLSAQKGKDKVEQMLESINAIASGNDEIINQMQKSNKEISDIVVVIKEISEKTQVINDIVFQTKLLSFNASVEAARAGEHGKGFAVVAEEVGNLASMSGKAANEITEMLTRSVKRVTDIVDGTKGLMDNLIKQSKQKVESGTLTAKECAQSLDEILANVSSVNEMVREISNASHEQSTGVREVNKAMSELDQVTQSNSTIAQESSHTANELKSQADRLNSLVAELTFLVEGHGSKNEHEKKEGPTSGSKKETRANVVSLTSHKKANSLNDQKENASSSKKVVGLEMGTPKRNDPRFEDA